MRKLLVIFFFVPFLGVTQEAEKAIYWFNPKHLTSSLRHELGASIGVHWTKSPMITTYTNLSDGIAYPEPVFTRVIGIGAGTYEPRARLLEYKSHASISLDLPMTLSFSVVDVLSGTGFRYSAAPLTQQELNSNIFAKERGGILGFFHVEGGALLSLNLGQGATIENTSPVGATLSAGVNYIHGPLLMNFLQEEDRANYAGYRGWATFVTRFGMHINRMAVYYMFGIAPTRVIYQTGSTFEPQFEWTNTYNRLSLSFRLGR